MTERFWCLGEIDRVLVNEAYRARITDIDTALGEQLRTILRRGIDEGVLRDVDVQQVSEYLLSTIVGTIERYATTEDVSVEAVYGEGERYLEQRVIA